MNDVLTEIAAERKRQDAKWGEQNHSDTDPVILWRLTAEGGGWRPDMVAQRIAEEHEIPTGRRARHLCQNAASGGRVTWAHILIEEVAEAVDATVETDPALLRAELVQVAAVAVAWIEAIDRRAET